MYIYIYVYIYPHTNKTIAASNIVQYIWILLVSYGLTCIGIHEHNPCSGDI